MEWHTIGGICERVHQELETDSLSRFNVLANIGIDETSCKRRLTGRQMASQSANWAASTKENIQQRTSRKNGETVKNLCFTDTSLIVKVSRSHTPSLLQVAVANCGNSLWLHHKKFEKQSVIGIRFFCK